MKSLCVFCGASAGRVPAYGDSARAFGETLGREGIELVWGAGNVGLMGAVADAVLAHGGKVVGVIPTFLKQKEVAHLGLTELIETADMTSRKNTMIALASGFIALPGGLGTYEELFEVLSQAQLRLHPHPVGVLNVAGFFDPLLALLRDTVRHGFMPAANLSLLCVADSAPALLAKMAAWQAQDAVKWVQPSWKQT